MTFETEVLYFSIGGFFGGYERIIWQDNKFHHLVFGAGSINSSRGISLVIVTLERDCNPDLTGYSDGERFSEHGIRNLVANAAEDIFQAQRLLGHTSLYGPDGRI